MTETIADVTAIIAAFNAQATIGRSVQSALFQPETAEVLVIDDASQDGTRDVVTEIAGSDARVRLIAMQRNGGPAVARNRGLDEAAHDRIAILDSDDLFLPSRLSRLYMAGAAEIIADNIVFANPDKVDEVIRRDWGSSPPGFANVSAEDFVRGNLRRHGLARGELGFLKPVLSLNFLRKHGLRYDETLRLGEDYDLYLRMLLAGARMRLTRAPGYLAMIRESSLSARHTTEDLLNLHEVFGRHLDAATDPGLVSAIRAYRKEIRVRLDHRRVLDFKRNRGAFAALTYAFGRPGRPGPVLAAIARDKLRISSTAAKEASEEGFRLLLS
ncbi:glycosyltransferase family 2 protein [Wenxinia marina]|uniref:Glycosyltransferase involved in cell wall biogenesis n=1 Tax=Wenxinia marina DSM 24838 TaxID=1123501 RepID=A0A0D0Q448_9RHOB|nr:glycosyltransferase family 2 protein [Wenxinia marina]KIQ69289.1 Glycosyltransferase involved in cell wall biogenesis [Wenxinia marina DSM 24838]GGL71858.1 glycosyl hydrolase [Wenxinia marina]